MKHLSSSRHAIPALFAVLLALTILVPAGRAFSAVKASGQCGAKGSKVTWSLSDKGVLTIAGKGKMQNYKQKVVDYSLTFSTAPWDQTEAVHNGAEGPSLHKSIKKVVVKSGVTSIGNFAFYGCRNLKTVSLPASVTVIGDSAFEDCSSLKTINVPRRLASLGSNALCWTAISSFKLPSTLKKLGKGAFSYCKNFSGTVTIPSAITAVPDSLFCGCSNLKTVKLHSDIRSIGNLAFFNTSVTGIALPSGLKKFGEYAFGSTKLKKITIPSKITAIPSSAFSECSFTSIKLPSGIKSIGGYAFSSCYNLKSITIPSKVTVITEGTFQGCEKLEKVQLPGGLKKIEAMAFEWCGALTSITIPSSVTEIGRAAFDGCKKLSKITIKSKKIDPETVCGMIVDEFSGKQTITLMVPGSLKKAYQEIIEDYEMENVVLKAWY